jgi:hypothetical protein
MDINKTFYVETSPDGKTKIYNINKRFFTGKPNTGGLMRSFGSEDDAAKNTFIALLKKEGWIPLGLEDIKKTKVNEIGIITAYPFKYRKGYMTIEKIESLARDKSIKWARNDHYTNPFSALGDYTDVVYSLKDGDTKEIESLKRQLSAFADRLQDIGANEIIENFFTQTVFVPDPRRFNKTVKELWRYYRHHLNECGRLIMHDHIAVSDGQLNVDDVISNLKDTKLLQVLISDEAYEKWLKSKATKP